MVEEQKGVELIADPRCDGAAQLHACALNGDLRLDNLRNGSKVVHACIDEVREKSIT